MLTLHIEASTTAELLAKACAALGMNILAPGEVAPAIPSGFTVKETVVEDKPKTETKADKPKAEAKVEEKPPVVEDKPKDEAPSAEGLLLDEPGSHETNKPYYDAVIKPAVLKVSQKHQRAGVENLLEPYAVDNASKVPAGKYPELLATIATLLEE